MTNKTEAQPEALRLADELIEQAACHREIAHCCDCRPEDTINWSHYLQCGNAATELRRQHEELQQLKAQLSARQAAPEMPEPDFYVRPSIAAFELPWGVCMHEDSGSKGAYLADTVRAMLSAAPHPPEREPQKHAENRELAETAMRFVDRAGDVHPGIDDADRICGEFHAAMMEVIEKWHPMPMPPGIGAPNDR